MERFVKIALFLVMVLFLTAGCGSNNEEKQKKLTNKSDHGTLSNKVHEQDIYAKLYLPQSEFPTSVKTIPFKVKNLGDTTVTLGMEYRVEKYKKGYWYVIHFKPNVGFIKIARLLKPVEIYKGQVSTDLLDYSLTEGRYRIVKKVDSKILGAEFQIID